jgi:hypothetical protein
VDGVAVTRLAAVVYASDNAYWTGLAVAYLRENSDPALTTVVLVDNGSRVPYPPGGHINHRYEENVGGNAVFHRWITDGWLGKPLPDIVAFVHCDLMVLERGWDKRVLAAFDADPDLALVGFVGSNEIDERGGRGGGTMLNFRGQFYDGIGQASPAEVHGGRVTGLHPAAVVDHCAMVFRRSVLETLTPQEGHYAPEHFYDRILSCEVLERGLHIAVLGIDVDHFSGGIGDGMEQADELRRRWLDAEGIAYNHDDTYSAVYKESERRFFARYKGFFPVRVDADYRVHPALRV